MADSIQPGVVGEVAAVVGAADLASAFGSGTIDVYATPAMVALMERAAVAAVDGRLEDGATTVGTRLDVRHLAASPPGIAVRARAELVAVDGRRLTFRVEAFDAVEKIGDGTHERVVVQAGRLLDRANGKVG